MKLEDITPFELPDVSTEEEALHVATESYDLLQQYYEKISSVGKISQAEAKHLVEEMAVEYPTQIAMESFTQLPTRTNLEVTLEGIGGAAVRAFVNLVKQAVALLVKLVQWMIDQSLKLFDHFTNSKRYVKNLRVVTRANIDLRKAGVDRYVVTVRHDDDVRNTSASVTQAVEQYRTNYSALSAELLSNGRHVQAVRVMALRMPTLARAMTTKINYINELLKKTIRDENDVYVVGQSFITGAMPITTAWIEKLFAPLNLQTENGSKPSAPPEYFKAMFNQLMKLRELKTGNPIDIEVTVDLICKKGSGMDEAILPLPKDMGNSMIELRKQMNSFNIENSPSNNYPELRERFRTAFNELSNELQCMQLMMSMATLLTNSRDQLLHDTLFYELKTLEYHRAVAAASGEAKAIESVNEAQRNMRKDLDK